MMRYLLAISLLLVTVTGFAQSDIVLTAQVYRTINVRSGPGTQYAIIGRLSGGMEIPVTGRSDMESNWLAIDLDGQQGWVAFFTVTLNSDPELLPVVEPRTPPVQGTPAQTAVREFEASTEVYVTIFRRVNVRSGPGTDFERLGTLYPVSTADILGRTSDNQWLMIDYNGESGWVAYFVVSITGDIDSVSVYESQNTISSTHIESITLGVITRFNTNLREQPDVSSPILAVIPYGTTLEAEARTLDRAWLRVSFDNQIGWILTSLVSVAGNSNLALLPVDD